MSTSHTNELAFLRVTSPDSYIRCGLCGGLFKESDGNSCPLCGKKLRSFSLYASVRLAGRLDECRLGGSLIRTLVALAGYFHRPGGRMSL